ncbi:MAG: S1 RNA-binding domain-containing protein [Candidatus Gastranaerophilales bacterium]|nr:S1 RNA-binding domain-containing protein [Candidatus Gastranaerophilales bacterium]
MSENLSFAELLEKYDYKFNKGDLIKGIVVAYDSNSVLVDIGAKTTAILPNREVKADNKPIKDVLKQGEEYEFLILKEEDSEGHFMLSHKKVVAAYSWRELEKIDKETAVLEGEVLNIVKGGLMVDVMGIRGFVPSSHLRTKPSEDLVGKIIELKILSMDNATNNLILSNRKSVNEESKNTDLLADIQIGQVVEGEVVRLADFGAFIDIGGIDGLLPLSQMSWRWIDHPADLLKISEKIKTEVIGIDHDKKRVSLSLKSLQENPWEEAKDKIREGEKIKGVVTRLKPFGAFIEVLPGVEALLPQKEVLEYQNATGNLLEVSKEIETTVIRFTPDDRRISLSFSGKKTD